MQSVPRCILFGAEYWCGGVSAGLRRTGRVGFMQSQRVFRVRVRVFVFLCSVSVFLWLIFSVCAIVCAFFVFFCPCLRTFLAAADAAVVEAG